MEQPANGRPGVVFTTDEERTLCFPAMMEDDRLRLFAFERTIADEYTLSSAEWHLVRESLVSMHKQLGLHDTPTSMIRAERYAQLIQQADAVYAESVAAFTGRGIIRARLLLQRLHP